MGAAGRRDNLRNWRDDDLTGSLITYLIFYLFSLTLLLPFIFRPELLALSWFCEGHYLSSLALRFQEGPLAHGVTLHDRMTLEMGRGSGQDFRNTHQPLPRCFQVFPAPISLALRSHPLKTFHGSRRSLPSEWDRVTEDGEDIGDEQSINQARSIHGTGLTVSAS